MFSNFLKKNAWIISSYTIVGIGTSLGYLMAYIILIEFFGLSAVLSAVIGYLPWLMIGYWLCYKWVFKSSLSLVSTSTKYLIINGMGYLLNIFGIYFSTVVIELNYIFGQGLTFIMVVIHNFCLNYYWTFKNQ